MGLISQHAKWSFGEIKVISVNLFCKNNEEHERLDTT